MPCAKAYNRASLIRVAGRMQAVALVFDHILLSPEEEPTIKSPVSPSSDGSRVTAMPTAGATTSGSANAALMLLDDLCLMANGRQQAKQLTDRYAVLHPTSVSQSELNCD